MNSFCNRCASNFIKLKNTDDQKVRVCNSCVPKVRVGSGSGSGVRFIMEEAFKSVNKTQLLSNRVRDATKELHPKTVDFSKNNIFGDGSSASSLSYSTFTPSPNNIQDYKHELYLHINDIANPQLKPKPKVFE